MPDLTRASFPELAFFLACCTRDDAYYRVRQLGAALETELSVDDEEHSGILTDRFGLDAAQGEKIVRFISKESRENPAFQTAALIVSAGFQKFVSEEYAGSDCPSKGDFVAVSNLV